MKAEGIFKSPLGSLSLQRDDGNNTSLSEQHLQFVSGTNTSSLQINTNRK
jgi:hypothetical protein